MKHLFLLASLFCTLMACGDKQLSRQEIITDYYGARDARNFTKIKTLIADSITITAGDYIMPYTRESFYEVFKWDSVFRTSYEVVELEESGKRIVASISISSGRHEFLKNDPMQCRYGISFDSGKISKIEELECKDADWNAWQAERDSLVSWTKKNHPEPDGFINDMTMEGAQNYVKAIELYKSDKITQEANVEQP